MAKLIDLTGQRFGRLTVVERDCLQPKGKRVYWICRCDCGNYTVVSGRNLTSGDVKSCGCLKLSTRHKRYNLTGQRFGRLLVIERDCLHPKGGKVDWICMCGCGNYTVVKADSLIRGFTKSCGCLKLETHKTHEHSKTRIYRIWNAMKRRCLKSDDYAHKNYGGRGISVCSEWQKFEPFCEWAMANGYADNLTLDREDVNGNYEPSNCRWVTMKEQQNNKRNNVKLTYDGETHTLSEWSEITGIPNSTIQQRHAKGLSPEYVLHKK